MLAFLAGPGRTWLLLSGAAALPLLLFGGWVGYLAAVQTRVETSRNAALAVDNVAGRIAAEIAAQLDVVRTLAASVTLDEPDLTAFRIEAERVRAEQPLWQTIELALPSGEQILNLLRPAGAALGPTADLTSLTRSVSRSGSAVGGIGPIGSVSGRRLVALRAPVIRDGTLRYVVSAALVPDGITTLLQAGGLPADWVGVVLDGSGRIVARTRAAAADQGQLASPALRAAIATAPQGTLRGHTREGVPVETVYRSLHGSDGWVIAFGIPLATLEGPMRRALVLLAGEGCAGLLLAALLTSLVARDLAQRRADETDRATRSLNASEEGRALAVEAADLGVWRWAIDADAFDGSTRSLALLGVPSRGADEPPLRWAEATAAIPAAEHDTLAKAVRACIQQGTDLNEELRVGGDAGRPPSWVRLAGRPLDGGPGRPALLHGVVSDITGRKQAEAERLDLLRRMASAQEDERRRIARELHDQVGQTVTGLSLGLKTLEAVLAGAALDPAVQNRLTWLRSLAADIGQDIHRAASDLRPAALDDFGLAPALAALAATIAQRHGIVVDVQVIGLSERLPPGVETVVYRIVQEALTNMLKHAQAGTASVLLENRTTGVKLIVEDDGVGFDPEASHEDGRPRLGLSGIRERLRLVGGALEVESAPGAGMTLFVVIPHPPADPA